MASDPQSMPPLAGVAGSSDESQIMPSLSNASSSRKGDGEDNSNNSTHSSGPTRLNVHAKDYSSLKLSGRIISVSYCLPHIFTYTREEPNPWTLQHRSGTSALFDSFRFLSSDLSSWKHVHVGWTGEIVHRRARKGISLAEIGLERNPPPNKRSAPVLDLRSYLPPPPFPLNRADRGKLEQMLREDARVPMLPVWLHDTAPNVVETAYFHDQTRWRQYSEHEIFRLFHYKHPDVVPGDIKIARWEHYVRMNKAFVDRVLEVYNPGDIIMVHDYHLLLLPAMLRERIADIKINLFLHVPFPSVEYFRELVGRKEVLTGMLGADMVAFQAVSYMDHFKSCCMSLLTNLQCSETVVEVAGREVHVANLPVGINNEAMLAKAFNDPVLQLGEKLKRKFGGRKIIIGRDRVDATRGVVLKLQSFAELLFRYPEWHGKVVLVQITAPVSIEDKVRGAANNPAIIAMVAKQINGRFGKPGYVPIHYYSEYVRPQEYHALLRVADLGLITSVRDGMSTTSLEFALLQKEKHSPLLLSEFSGTSSSLPGTIDINPWDWAGTAESMNRALLMLHSQRKGLYNALTPSLEANPVQKWVEKSISKLCSHMSSHDAREIRPEVDVNVMFRYLSPAVRRLFIFDYDGTLTPIVEEPEAAVPCAALIENLSLLAADKRNAVWVVSGRDRAFLSRTLGNVPGLGFSAEHGSFMKKPDSSEWVNLAAGLNMEWQQKVLDMMRNAIRDVSGCIVEQKSVSVTWHYRRADPAVGLEVSKRLAEEIGTLGSIYDIEVMKGKANIEVRPRSINKGQVVRRLIGGDGDRATTQPSFILCVGDDTTDEDMFRALRRSTVPMTNVFGVIVAGHHKTMASWRIASPAAVIDMLGKIVEHEKGKQNGTEDEQASTADVDGVS